MPEARRRSLTLIVCCAAQFMVVLDVSIVNVALPSISGDLHFSPANLQWVVNAYTLTFAGFLLLGGRAADLIGRKAVFVVGLAVFGAASLAGGIAQSEGWLIAARAAQGLGGAIVAPATLSILTTTFTEGAERNRALGLWAAMGGAGGAAGSLLGGILTQALSWRFILFINVPLVLVAIVASRRTLAADVPRERVAGRHFDTLGAATVTAGLVLLTYAIVGTEQHGWGAPRTLVLLAAGGLLLVGFIVVERTAQAPLMPLGIFRSRPLTGANVVVLFMGASAFGMWYFVSLYLQDVLGFSPIRSGLAFLPMTAAIIVFSQVSGKLVGRIGPGPVLAGGMACLGAGMLLFTGIDATGGYRSDVLVPSLLCSAGLGFSFVPVTIAATSGVERPQAGLASGLVNTFRQVGGSLGLALLATVASRRTAEVAGSARGVALNAGYERAFALGGAFALAGALAAVLILVRPARTPAMPVGSVARS